MSCGSRRRERGFTLVEMLVVIAIIGVLIALLLPAIQSARESARRTKCLNNVKQLAFACLEHETAWEFLPTGGWGWGWAGDPNRGFDERQPGGWHYNILPYLERNALHDLGKGQPDAQRRADGAECAATPVASFICPTRGRVRAYRFVHPYPPYYNIDKPTLDPTSNPVVYESARSDYAACGGDTVGINPNVDSSGPLTLQAGDAPNFDWDSMGGTATAALTYRANGVIFRRSKVSRTDIPDGASNTYLLGERTLDENDYHAEVSSYCNDQGWNLGFDYDTNRWTNLSPAQDAIGGLNGYAFGSAHFGIFHMAMCDGSVHPIGFEVDPNVHRKAGNRKDSRP